MRGTQSLADAVALVAAIWAAEASAAEFKC